MSKRKDVGQTNSESTAVMENRVPPAPAPVPTLFKTDFAAHRVSHEPLEVSGACSDSGETGQGRAGCQAEGTPVGSPEGALSPQMGAATDAVPPSSSAESAPEVRKAEVASAVGEIEPPAKVPTMPPVATLGGVPALDITTMSESPSIVPDGVASVPPASAASPAAAVPSRSNRFALLAASVALAAGIGAVAGSLGQAEFRRHLLDVAATPHAEASEDMRGLKDTVAQLRANVKTLADNVTAMRASITASHATVNGQLSKITEALDHGDRHSAAAAAPVAETTGSIAAPAPGEPKPPAKPPVVEGWAIRKVYDGTALIEGRYGIVEVEPGMNLPGLGRIQDIKRQDGHWVVVTAKGLIMPVH